MALKVGDKIQIKGPIKVGSNLLSKDEPENEYFKTFKDIIAILKSSMAQQDKLKWCSVAFNVLDSWFNLDEDEELRSCKYCKEKLIPSLHNLVEKAKIEYMPDFFDYYKRAYAFAARRDFECFVDYMEWNEPKKVYANRRKSLEPYVKALGELPFNKLKQYLIVSYPPSLGKCLKEDTLIWTPKGNIPIKDINIGDEVYSMKDKECVIEKVTNKWNTKKKQVKITLKSGKEIITSPEHRMLTFNGYKMAKELTTDDYFYSYLSKLDTNERIDDDELLFITCMIFEGHCKYNGMSYTGENNEITQEFLKCCDRLNINYSKDTKPNNTASTYRLRNGNDGSRNRVELLQKYGIYEELCYEKRLPQCFFTMPIDQKYKFIGIMFATDGYISSKKNCGTDFGITLANEGLIDDIQTLLFQCDIYSKKGIKHTGKFTSWRLTVPKEYMLELKDKIYCYQKQDKLLSLEESKILKRGNLSVKYPKEIFTNLPPTGERGGYVEELHIERYTDKSLKLFEKYLKEYPELEKYKYKDFFWEEIKSIEYIDEETNMVDIEVSNTHNFIANGYVSHNSYIATLYSAWGFGLSTSNSIIRMSYSDELVLGFSRNIKNYICSQEFSDIFTNFKIYNGKPFEVERESDWKIKNANVPKSSHIARTRNGSTTGERATFAIIFDDMTKGAEEANSESIHRGIYDKWLTEWWNRRDGQRCNFIFLGTQWSPEDILNRIIVDRNAIEELKPTSNPYVMENSTTTVIRVPMLDDEGKTTCDEVYPQEIAEQIRDTTDPFLFSCVYQQNPIAPTGREFAYECIRTYTELPENLSPNSFATLDTARKGKDNVAMPIVKTDNNGNYYLIDAIFEQKAMDFLYDKIINKIIDNNVTLLVIENNIDTSLKALLEDKLKKRGYTMCEIREKFNTVKKEERIKNNRGIVQKQLVFPDKMVFKPNTDVGRLMENLTKYSFDYANVHDDAPDSICMVASEVIMQNYKFGKIKPIKRWF